MGLPWWLSSKEPSCMQELHELQVQSLGWEHSLEEGMVTHSSILAWRIPVDRGALQATVHGIAKNGDFSKI